MKTDLFTIDGESMAEQPTSQEQANYLQWLRDKVRLALGDGRPAISHRQVMSAMREHLARNCDQHKS
ncbi:MAG: stability determinant [Massilia sp.]